MERVHRIFPNNLRLHRKTCGYTQRQVAALLGLHDAVPVSMWEKGAMLPNTANLIKLSVLYQTLPTKLYEKLFQHYRDELRERELQLFTDK